MEMMRSGQTQDIYFEGRIKKDLLMDWIQGIKIKKNQGNAEIFARDMGKTLGDAYLRKRWQTKYLVSEYEV